MHHFLVANFELSLSVPFNKFTIFRVSITYTIVTEFCVKVVSSDLSIMKNIVVSVFLKSLPITLNCCGSFSLVCLLRSIAISL